MDKIKQLFKSLKRKPQSKKIKREIRWLRSMATVLIVFGSGWLSGCACVTGMVKGGWEGARQDINAAREVAKQGSQDLGDRP